MGLFLRADGTPNPARLSGKGGKEVNDAIIFLRDKFRDKSVGRDMFAAEMLYLIKNDIDSPPICEICNQKSTQFYSYLKGYNNICGDKSCVVKKRERTNLLIYGYANAAMADTVRDKISNNPRKTRNAPIEQVYDLNECISEAGELIRCFSTGEKYQEIRDRLRNKYDDINNWAEVVYRELTNNPVEYCSGGCGRKSEFLSMSKGYSKRRCLSCAAKECEPRRNETKILNNGTDYKQKEIEKSKQTNLERYGKENPFQVEKFKDKSRKTMKERYGEEYSARVPELVDKGKNTYFKNHGRYRKLSDDKILLDYLNGVSRSLIAEKFGFNQASLSRILERNSVEFRHRNRLDRLPFKNIAEDYTNGITVYSISKKYECREQEVYLILNRLGISYRHRNTRIETVVLDILDRIGIEYQRNDKKTFSGKLELDFLIPEYNLAIETNGLYWHSVIGGKKNRKYHYDKFMACKERGIKLYQFWEPDIIKKPQIIESMIVNAIGKTPVKKFARNGDVLVIPPQIFKSFFEENHLQGRCGKDSKALGLYIDNELVSCLAYIERPDKTIITRYCSRIGISVVGGFSKLLKGVPGDTIRTYSSNDISWGELYSRNGFEFISDNGPDLWYTDRKSILNRQGFMKSKMKDKFDKFDEDKTEWENAYDNGYDRIYKAGTVTWEMKRK